MKYKICRSDSQYFATSLRIDDASMMLNWNISGGADTLIIQTCFGQEVTPVLPAICKALEQTACKAGRYVEILNGVWVRCVSAEEKVASGGCLIHKKASRYTVLACRNEEDCCRIYEPYEKGMNSAHCDIPLEVHIDIQKQQIEKGFLRKQTVDTGFYIVKFPEELKDAYMEGGLILRVGELDVPVTAEMIRQGTVYVETEYKPCLIPLNEGIVV